MYEENGNIYKDIENLKKKEKEILELKIKIIEIKKITRGIQNQILAGGRISKREDRRTEIIESEEQKEKKLEDKKVVVPLGHHQVCQYPQCESQKEMKQRKG